MQNNLRVFGVILVPGVVHRFSGPGHGERGNRVKLETLLMEMPGHWAVIVTGRLEADLNGQAKAEQSIAK